MKTPSRHSKGRKFKSKQSVKKIRLAQCHVVVIGAGTIGRAVAMLLASLGVRHMSIYDPAMVTRKNIAQGFMDFDVGMAKVDAVANIVHQQNPRMELLSYRTWFRRFHSKQWQSGGRNAIFICLDSQAIRKRIWNRVRDAAQFLCDTRLGADSIRVLISINPAADVYFASTLSEKNRRTYSRDLIMANIAACLMVMQFLRWLQRQPIILDQTFMPPAHWRVTGGESK